ncbi:MAG: TlpA disulfide reductase family protein [Chloroflexi bacterium]|nr:TlpA disulfide reductase family protein [Chloroflexota bacterium]
MSRVTPVRWMSRRRVLIGGAVVAASALAACGEAGDDEQVAAEVEATVAASPQATAVAAAAATPTATTAAPEPTATAAPEPTPTPTAAPEPEESSTSESDVRSFPAGDQMTAPDFTWEHYAPSESLGRMSMNLTDILAIGKPVVLNFWAGLCPPCRREMPEFQEAYEEFKDRVILCGVDVGPFVNLGSTEDAVNLMSELGITYPLGTTFNNKILIEYRILGMPATVFITARGTIVRTWNGVLDKNGLLDLVAELEEASEAGL